MGQVSGLVHYGPRVDCPVSGTLHPIEFEEDGRVDVDAGVETVPEAWAAIVGALVAGTTVATLESWSSRERRAWEEAITLCFHKKFSFVASEGGTTRLTWRSSRPAT